MACPTARQRFASAMSFGDAAGVPLLEEGLREPVLERWRSQGLAGESALNARFHYDRRERIELDVAPDRDQPWHLPHDWSERVSRWRSRDHLLEWAIHPGLLLSLGVDDSESLDRVLCAMMDAPLAAQRAMERRAQAIVGLAQRILSEVDLDFVSFSEPVASAYGPLISPALYRQMALGSYRAIIRALRAGGVRHVALVSYANVRPLLDDIVDAGFDVLWAIERASPVMDYLALRRCFGRQLRLIGGIDLDCLARGEDAIRHEMMRQVPALLAEGGYIPLVDGRVREETPLSGYCIYRQLLEELARP